MPSHCLKTIASRGSFLPCRTRVKVSLINQAKIVASVVIARTEKFLKCLNDRRAFPT